MADCAAQTRKTVRRRTGILVVACMTAAMIAAGLTTLPARDNRDYARTQKEIVRFELTLNNLISSIFSSNPFAVVQKPKGAYLPGYGVSVSFLINIHRAVINTPFGQVTTRDLSPELKRRRIEELKERLIQVLQKSGDDFRQLDKDDCVTIVAYVEDRNFPDEPNSNRTIVLSILKKDLDELGRTTDRLREFKQRMKIVEY